MKEYLEAELTMHSVKPVTKVLLLMPLFACFLNRVSLIWFVRGQQTYRSLND